MSTENAHVTGELPAVYVGRHRVTSATRRQDLAARLVGRAR